VNVLLITTDQQRADTLGVEGSPLAATPRLDVFAAQGTRFAGARTQNPLCQPARATILTGTYPSTHGVLQRCRSSVRRGGTLDRDAARAIRLPDRDHR
jgi:arylsulfatase A-like enzyme